VGSYSSAISLLSATLQELRDSTAFKAGDSAVVALVAQLVALQQKALSGNPGAAASAAAASAAKTGAAASIFSTNISVSSNAVNTLVSNIINDIQVIIDVGGSGSSQAAKDLASTTLQEIRGSPAFLAGDPTAVAAVKRLTELLTTIMAKDPAKTASAALASAAVAANVAGLSSQSVLTSNTAALELGNTTLAQANTLLALGSYAAAQATILGAMTQIRESTAFKAGEPRVLEMQDKLEALYQKIVQSNPGATASAAAAAAADSSNMAALSSGNKETSSKAAAALGASLQTKIDLLTSTGDYAGAAAVIGPFLILLRSSPAFMGDDPATVELVNRLTELQISVLAKQPGATASAAAASSAIASSIAALSSPNVSGSVAAATTLGAAITAQVISFLTIGSYSAAADLLTTTLQQLRASSAFKAGDPTVLAIVAELLALQERAVSSNPATTASAARASAAVSAAASDLSSPDTSKSSAAATALTNSVVRNATQLMSVGNYDSALAAVESTLIQLRASTAFAAGDPATLAAIEQLSAFQTIIVSSNPSATASAAAASSASSVAAAALRGTDIPASAAAVDTIVQIALRQVNQLLSSGQYATASSLLQATIAQLRTSSAAIANDPAAVANIAKLITSLQTVMSSNPATTASAAAESSAQANLLESIKSTDVPTSAAAAVSLVNIVNSDVAYTISIGKFADAQALISKAIEQIMTSSAYAAGDPATLALVANLQNKMIDVANQNPETLTAQNTASAAQSYYMSALQGTDLASSVGAADNLAKSVTASVNSLMASGAPTVASQLINQTLQALYFSTAYMSGDPATLEIIKNLRALLQAANAALPPSVAAASAAAASAAQVQYMANLQNSDSTISAQACMSLGTSVISTVNILLSLGSNQVAYNVLKGTIASISTSTAVASGNPQVLSLLKTLSALQAAIPLTAEPPPAQASQAATPENVFSLSENSKEGYGYGDGYGYGTGNAEEGAEEATEEGNAQEGGGKKRRSKRARRGVNKTRKYSKHI
jgi:hypothetical protein